LIPRIQHGTKYTLRCIILIGAQSLEPRLWPFFMGWMPINGEPIHFNGAFHVSLTIMRFVMASAAEAELGVLYHNCQTGMIFRLTHKEMGHKQQKLSVHCDNTTSVGIANNSIKRQRSHLMEMQFFGMGIKLHKVCTTSAGILDKRIWLITRANITWCPTMSMSDHSFYTQKNLQDIYHGLRDLAL
jgi:hypothetical protein